MRWIEWDEEKLLRLRRISEMMPLGEQLLKLATENKVVIGNESYLYSNNPERFDRIISMNAWIEYPEQAVAGMKWISSKASNTAMGWPRGGAVTVLNNAVNGFPIIAYDGAPISLARTAMVNCLALTRLFDGGGPDSVAFIGAGQINSWQADYINQLWPSCKFFVFDLDDDRSRVFSSKWDAEILDTWEDAKEVDVIGLATAGPTAVGWISWKTEIRKSQVWLHTSLRDMQPRLEQQFGLVVVDDHVLATSEGTTHSFAWRENWVKKEISLADLVVGGYEPEVSDYPVLVSPMGLAMWDIGIGYKLFKEEFAEENAEMFGFTGDVILQAQRRK